MSRSPFSAVLYSLTLCAAFLELVPAIERTDKGKVKEATIGKIVLTDADGANERSYVVPQHAMVTLNDREAKITDLKLGDAVEVRLGMEGEVISISAKRTDPPKQNRPFLHYDDVWGSVWSVRTH